MKNGITFDDMICMGYEAPASNLVDFSDTAYDEAAKTGRFEQIEKNGMTGIFIDGNFKRMKVQGQWVYKVDSIEAATKFFKG